MHAAMKKSLKKRKTLRDKENKYQRTIFTANAKFPWAK